MILKPRERIHPGQRQVPRAPLSTDTIKRKVSQPIALQLIDTSHTAGTKRRARIDAFKRSRSFTNVEHTETQLGMDYIEENENDLSWKPFGPKRSISQVSSTSTTHDQSNDEQPSTDKFKSSSINDNNSSDEEFDVAWERRAKQKARKEAASAPIPSKRTVHFSPSTHDPVELIELDLDETTQDDLSQTKDQNNNSDNQQTVVVNLDDDDETTDTQSQITTTSMAAGNPVDDSDDEIIALSDDETPIKSNISPRKKPLWTTSEIQVSHGNSQSQSLHNPYRIGIADPSLRSIFLPPPNSQPMSSGSRRTQGSHRKAPQTKRATSAK